MLQKGDIMGCKVDVLLTAILEIVRKNNCTLGEQTDFDRHILDIVGTDEDQKKCAMELEEKLGEVLI